MVALFSVVFWAITLINLINYKPYIVLLYYPYFIHIWITIYGTEISILPSH